MCIRSPQRLHVLDEVQRRLAIGVAYASEPFLPGLDQVGVRNEIELGNNIDIDNFKEYVKKVGELEKQAKCELNNYDKDRGRLENKNMGES